MASVRALAFPALRRLAGCAPVDVHGLYEAAHDGGATATRKHRRKTDASRRGKSACEEP